MQSTSESTPANSRSRVLFASLVGTTIEFYDFYVYATAAVLVFPHLFFPPGNETAALLAACAIMAAAKRAQAASSAALQVSEGKNRRRNRSTAGMEEESRARNSTARRTGM